MNSLTLALEVSQMQGTLRIVAIIAMADRRRNWLLIPLLSLIACSYGSGEFVPVAGHDFPAERRGEIHQGLRASDVKAIFGTPLEITRFGQELQWRYVVVEEARNTTYLLGVVPISSPAHRRTTAAIVHLRNGVVQRLDYSSVVSEIK